MTKEERKKAIKVLDDMKVKIDIPKAAKTQNDRNWALDVAIQALSQEPTEKPMTVDEMEREYEKSKALFHKIVECEDAISRQAVKELIKSGVSTDTYDDVEQVCKWIDALPSVTQKSVFDEITAEIYEHFMTIDGGVHDESAIKCMEIIGKYKGDKE